MSRIRVLIAEDHDVVQDGFKMLINGEDDMEVVATAVDGVEAVLRARATKPDVILMDLRMPRKGGIEALNEICQENPSARVLMMTGYNDDERLFTALRMGAKGYLPKLCRSEELFQAIRYVYQGEIFLHPTSTRHLIDEVNGSSEQHAAHESLTSREMDVLQLVAQGFSNKEVADQLYVSPRTVRTHMSNILSKLNLSNRTQATLYALEQGVVELGQPVRNCLF